MGGAPIRYSFRQQPGLGVDYLASDSSQRAQNVEQYITQYDDGSRMDRLMLPRWPTNIFYNVTNPAQLKDEYNYIYNGRFVNAGQNPCQTQGASAPPKLCRNSMVKRISQYATC